jgi:CDP-paratose 2-epimerase
MKWLVTGGVGFIGTNLVVHLLEHGHRVVVVDDLSRGGVDINASFLADQYNIHPAVIDVSDTQAITQYLTEQPRFDAVAHLAGQVSLLESIRDPMRDFEVNAHGTINLLNFLRTKSPETAIIGMSSNKVYGDLSHVHIREDETRYVAPDWPNGFNESLPLEFHGPYGCSKGIADQYLADFARTYGLRTASLRQSSVYGPHQHPRSDQGWVAHLVSEAVSGRAIQLNGIGKQVRDLLHASDLAQLFVDLAETMQPSAINQFNIGGGTTNALSILDLFGWLESHTTSRVVYRTGTERPSDQKVFISDNSAVSRLTGWRPKINLESGLQGILDSAR